MRAILSNIGTTTLLVVAILLGCLIGHFSPALGATASPLVDPLIIALVFSLFFGISLGDFRSARRYLGFLSLAWCANFIIVPLVGWGIASLFLSGQSLLYTGLIIYFMAPCTDWFLGFTGMAKGNVTLGSILLPINLITQVLLFPVFLLIFAKESAEFDLESLISTLWYWFLIPLISAIILRQILKHCLNTRQFTRALSLTSALVPFLLTILVCCIFADNFNVISKNAASLPIVLAAVFGFFVTTFLIVQLLSRVFQLNYPEHVLLTMTTSARNAPLMLALTTAAFPNQPLIYAALILGMLVEFPHLTALKHLLLRNPASNTETSSSVSRSRPPAMDNSASS